MARARLLKPGFFTNEDLGALPPHARLLFAGLWCIADREGRLEDRPERIKAEVLPYDKVSVVRLLSQLHDSGLIVQYEVGGKRYIQLPSFHKHQKPHMREVPSVIPEHNLGSAQALPRQNKDDMDGDLGSHGVLPRSSSRVHSPIPVALSGSSEGNGSGDSSREDCPALSESTDTGLNERMGIMIVAQPKIARDETLYSEAYQIALDHSYDQIQTAIQETRRSKDASGRPMAPYPSNWRRFLLADPKPVEAEGVRAILWNSGKAVGE